MLHSKGFTFIETLLTLTMLTVIAGIGVPIFQSLQVNNDLNIATNTLVQSLRKAQTHAQAVDGDKNWGVYIQNQNIIIFKGSSYAERDIDFGESFTFPSSITFTGLSEILFSRFSGETQNIGTITLTTPNASKQITINSKGVITY